jgi:pimeloyl-ACP methyl ester carboxylesterase
MSDAASDQEAHRDPFVLVHGAAHGGWCWVRVARLLRAAGHDVFTPTLTGIGERAHLLTPDVGPATMVQDIVAVLENEELRDVVLVGHSFGALVALGVADRVPHRLRRLVLLDGLVVEPGGRGFDGVPPEVAESRAAAAEASPNSLAFPQPLRSYTESFGLRDPLGNGLPVTYICCTDPPYPTLRTGQAIARREGWEWRDLATGHDAMISAPEGTAAELLRLAAPLPDRSAAG